MSKAGELEARLRDALGAEAVSSASPGPGEEALPLVAPETEEGFVAALALARERRLVVLPCGRGSKLGWTAPASRADLLLSTRRFAGVVAHEPADGTLTSRAGTTLTELRDAARRGGHVLTPDVAGAEFATLGGVLASGQSGWDRLRFGPSRHHVLGMRVLLSDGSLARSGGRLVKNVTGYDMHRLYTGSHGSLCVVLEAALRLFPAPERDVVVERAFADRAAALRAAREVLALPLRPVAVLVDELGVDGPADEVARLSVHLAGMVEPVEDEAAAVARCLGVVETLRDEAARARAAELRDAERRAERWPDLHVTARPSRLDAALEALASVLGPRATLRIQPGLATVDVRLEGNGDASAPWKRLAEETPALRARLAALGARLHLRNAPLEVRRAMHPLGSAGPGASLARALRDRLDPHALFARGRLADEL